MTKKNQFRPTLAMIVYTKLSNDARVLREAKAAVEAGFDVDIITLNDKNPVRLNGIHIIATCNYQYKGNNKLFFLLAYINFFLFSFYSITLNFFKKKYEIIHVHNMPNFLVFSCFVPKLLGAKLILDVHDLVPELFAEKFNVNLHYWVIRLLYMEERWSCNFADYIISTNRLHHKRFANNKINKKYFLEIVNSADEEIFHPFNQHKFNEDKIIIIFPTTIAKRLGLDILIDAAEILTKKDKPFLVKIFGDGEYRFNLEKTISEKKLSDNIYISQGVVSFETLSKEMDHAHIGVIPWPKNFSTNYQMPGKIHEYFIKSLCVVAPELDILKEYFDGQMLFFSPGNAEDLAEKISMLIDNRAMLKEYSNKSFLTYQSLPWQVFKDKYKSFLQELL